ncbi:MAG: thermonuclease family protein, partial [Thermoproteota archaeon]
MSYINLSYKFVLIFLIFTSYIFQYNLFFPQENFYIKIIEFYDKTDSIKVDLIRVIDGDTVEVSSWNEKRRVRIVGYDAYELSEPKGLEAKSYLEYLCVNAEVYLDVDDLEPKDKYNRTLGYLYCKKENEEIYRSVTKSFLILRPDLVKKPLQIPPDEHP